MLVDDDELALLKVPDELGLLSDDELGVLSASDETELLKSDEDTALLRASEETGLPEADDDAFPVAGGSELDDKPEGGIVPVRFEPRCPWLLWLGLAARPPPPASEIWLP